jgi:hypothetical protein
LLSLGREAHDNDELVTMSVTIEIRRHLTTIMPMILFILASFPE